MAKNTIKQINDDLIINATKSIMHFIDVLAGSVFQRSRIITNLCYQTEQFDLIFFQKGLADNKAELSKIIAEAEGTGSEELKADWIVDRIQSKSEEVDACAKMIQVLGRAYKDIHDGKEYKHVEEMARRTKSSSKSGSVKKMSMAELKKLAA